MTGFGREEVTFGETVIQVEIKSLNGKQLDVNMKIPPVLKAYEIDIRNLVQQQLLRGSMDVTVQIRQNGSGKPMIINTDLAFQYYKSIAVLATELNLPQNDILSALLKLPEVVSPATEILSEESWEQVKQVLQGAIKDLDKHRLNEGSVLEKDMQLRVSNILSYLEKVKEQEPLRIERIRERIEAAMAEWINKEAVDRNRMEQELIYYIEKLDISEETVRLANHCRYFNDILLEPDLSKGRKLNFVLQEIGREINTIGSKANDAQIQQWVVQMKDELEKAKEQVLNIL